MRRAHFCLLLVLGLLPAAFAQADYQAFATELNRGVTSYRAGKYAEAVPHLRAATALRPWTANPHMYLAMTYSALYVPGDENEENRRLALQGIERYQKALDMGASGSDALLCMKGIASLYVHLKEYAQAVDFYRMAMDAEPDDPEPHYAIGVVNWTLAHNHRTRRTHQLGLALHDPIIDSSWCSEIRTANIETVNDGIEAVRRALELRSDHEDAMAYLSMLYRERAAIQCGDQAACDRDIHEADAWMQRRLAISDAKENKARVVGEAEKRPN